MIVLVPVFRPGPRLTELATALRDVAPTAGIVVVDDGSGPGGATVLEALDGLGATVLRRPVHRGKGAALRAGFGHVAGAHPGRHVVCADADGQHHPDDILRVARHAEVTGRIALGVRRFGAHVPLRSRVGNVATRELFRAATGRRVRDTQTGLRAYPAALLPWLGTIPGDGFDYEMNVLLAAVEAGHDLDEVEIATTYLDGNASSHFGALSDSARVYRPLLRRAASRPFRRRAA
jgi:glycosyltransferase involved in cell wall biosynthesis